MKSFLLISPKNRTTYNFRGDLIRKIQGMGYRVTVTGPNRDDIDGVLSLGVDFIEVPVEKAGTNPLADISYCKALVGAMNQVKPDAVLGYTIKPVVYGCIAAHLAGIENVTALVTGAGATFSAASPKETAVASVARGLYRIGLRYARNVIFQNPDDRREFIQKRLAKEEKTHVVNGSGVNMSHFEQAPFPEQLTFFMLGRLVESKGVLDYLKAAEVVKSIHPEVRFCLLGKYEESLPGAVPKEIIEGYIARGIVERFDETNDVRPYYASSSVFVLPSYYREGVPRTILEAMAMGRPIITTDSVGCRETVNDGKNGFLVPPRNWIELATRMEFFADNPDAIAIMGRESQEICVQQFEVSLINGQMCTIMGLDDC